jgi:hypothetical protein
MNADAASILLVSVFAIVGGGAILCPVSHFLFLLRLRAAHPELWAAYWRITNSFASAIAKHYKLCSDDYSRITSLDVVRARRIDVLCVRLRRFVRRVAHLWRTSRNSMNAVTPERLAHGRDFFRCSILPPVPLLRNFGVSIVKLFL